ncbi:MAG: hypothetical protein FOGNACKC_05318 [Anaerolineae bacterium]|nr:hypothetical protein [Anaerolineae bacterium]
MALRKIMLVFFLALAVIPWLGQAKLAKAHGGGYPQLTNAEAGPYRVSVWTQPQPLTTDQAHFSVAVFTPLAEGFNTGLPVLDADVELILIPRNNGAAGLVLPIRRTNSVNKLYYETDVQLPTTGHWDVEINVSGDAGTGRASFSIDVQSPPIKNYWVLWGSVAFVAMVALWGARSFHRGGDLRRIVPALAIVVVVTAIGVTIITRATTPAAQAATRPWFWFMAGRPDLVVEVSASQWQWAFTYPDTGVTTTELMLPAGRNIELKLTSTDVIHSFGVPEFQLSQDIVPGSPTLVRVTPTQTGSYKVICEAFCGVDYQDMLAEINVVSPADFENWLSQQKQND